MSMETIFYGMIEISWKILVIGFFGFLMDAYAENILNDKIREIAKSAVPALTLILGILIFMFL